MKAYILMKITRQRFICDQIVDVYMDKKKAITERDKRNKKAQTWTYVVKTKTVRGEDNV